MKKQKKPNKHNRDYTEQLYDDMDKEDLEIEDLLKIGPEPTRISRPKGLTLEAQLLKQTKDDNHKRNINRIVIDYYLNNQLTHIQKGKKLTIPDLAYQLDMEQEELERELNVRLEKRNTLLADKDMATNYTRELLFGLIFKITANLDLASQQANILLAAQNGAYKAFISGEVNRAIANSTQALGPLQQLVFKLMDRDAKAYEADQRFNINILNQSETRQYVTVEEASKLLEDSRTHISVLGNPEMVADIPNLPEVKAVRQDLNSIGIRHSGQSQAIEDGPNTNPA